MYNIMAVENISSFSSVLEALRLIVSGGIGAAIIGLIGTLWVNRKLEQERAEYAKELASLKAELSKKHTIHKLQFEKEFAIYQELWKALVRLRDTCGLLALSGEFLSKGETPEQRQHEKAKAFSDAYDEAMKMVRFWSPFYAKEVYENSSRLTQIAMKQGLQALLTHPDSERYKQLQSRVVEMAKIIDDIEVSIRERIGLISIGELVE